MSLSPEEAEQKRQSEAIDRKLRVDLKEYENTIKILLLGQFLELFFIGWLVGSGRLLVLYKYCLHFQDHLLPLPLPIFLAN